MGPEETGAMAQPSSNPKAPAPSESIRLDKREDSKIGEGTEAFLSMARKRFARAAQAESTNRKDAVDDLKFKKGDQWPEQVKSSRTLEKRPCLTVNKMKPFVHHITNDQRQNRPSISVSPVGDKSDPKTAEMLRGLIRQIERTSSADIAYDTAFENAVSAGWGYWRVYTEYEGADTFDQVIKIGRIRNTFRVYLDPDHQEPDGSDAKWAFISDMIPKEQFREDYPKAKEVPFEQDGAGDTFKGWADAENVRIAEYFVIESKNRKLLALSNGHIGYEDELAPEVKAQIDADPSLVVRTRESEVKKIKWYRISAYDILDEAEWLGAWIPIVKVIGDEVDVEGKVTLSGIIRDAKDSQRMYNYWVTAETEQVALMPKAPYIVEEGQIEGHEQKWKNANEKSYPYLAYKGTSISGKQAPPPQRQPFAGPPAGVIQAKLGAAQDMQATTGIRFDATLQERMYDESGKALHELKRIGDLGNFHYVDNLARSLKHTGRILIDLIPKVYDTDRVITILREDDSEEQVRIVPTLGKPAGERPHPMNKGVEKLFNPKLGTYEVAVNIGPSYSTKRAEAADSMLGFVKAVPQSGPIIGDLIAKYQDWPGASEISARLAAMLPPQVQAILAKNMQSFPPEARSLLVAMQTQLQSLNSEHQKALVALGNLDKDRAIEQDRINKDFEAKLFKVAADLEKAFMSSVSKQMGDITATVKDIETRFNEQIGTKDLLSELAKKTEERSRALQ